MDDLSTKLIFLNSAQTALLDLHRLIEPETKHCDTCATLYPEIEVVHTILDRWQGLVLHGHARTSRAGPICKPGCQTHSAAYVDKVRQCVVVSNQGLNVAQNVRLRVADGDGYRVVRGRRAKDRHPGSPGKPRAGILAGARRAAPAAGGLGVDL